MLPLSPGCAERHGFEYHRHGTLSLFAALNTRTGEIIGKTVQKHNSEAFVALRDFIAGDVFTSRADLSRKLMHYIREFNKNPNRSSGATQMSRVVSLLITKGLRVGAT